jgi:hypothetical protein
MLISETPSKADTSLALGSGQIMCSLHAVGAGIVLAGGPVVYARQALEVTAALVHIPIR